MGLLQKNSESCRNILLLIIINLVCSFFDLALAQADVFAKAFESLNFPMEAITCLVNILVFGTTLIRGRLHLENGAREALGTLRGPKLLKLNGISGDAIGLRTVSQKKNEINGNNIALSTVSRGGGVHTTSTTEGGGIEAASTTEGGGIEAASTTEGGGIEAASVVMLSNGKPNSSMKQFMKSNAVDDVHSILLQYHPFNTVNGRGSCNCIKLERVEESTPLLPLNRLLEEISRQMPDNMPDNERLLPCRGCLTNGKHGCNRGDLGKSVVPDMLDFVDVKSFSAEDPICICIPLNDACDDNWTKRLASSLSSKDEETRGVRGTASKALEDYVDGNRGRGSNQPVEVYYDIVSFIGPRLSEILINIVLTFWFKVDGFSSSLAARRTIRDYLVESKGNGLAANAFLIKATAKFNADHVCQVLTFRGNCLSFITLSFIAGGVNMTCFVGWAVLIAFEGGDSAPSLSIVRVAVIIGAIGIALGMDCLYVYSKFLFFKEKPDYRVFVIIWEMVCVVVGIVVVTTVGTHVFGKWIYGALQVLVWVKWAIGSYILDTHRREEFGSQWRVLVFSTAFLLNAALAGVRSKWKPSWPWEANSLFSKAWHH